MCEVAATLITSRLAQIWGIHRRTVARLCNAGEIVSSTLPRSGQRRIGVLDAIDFARRKGFPTHELEQIAQQAGLRSASKRVLLASHDSAGIGQLADAGYVPTLVGSVFLVVEELLGQGQDALILDTSLGQSECQGLVAWLRQKQIPIRVGVIANEDDPELEHWTLLGAARVRQRPVDHARLAGELLAGGPKACGCR